MSSPNPSAVRIKTDVMKLLENKHEVIIDSNSFKILRVRFEGPKGTPYQEGTWMVRVEIPDKYPFKSPSVGFENKIFHPNIDETSGTVCLDVINQTWSPMYDLMNVFDTFLPQLLAYPNAADPLNGDAANLYIHFPEQYKKKVSDYIAKYATKKTSSATGEDSGTCSDVSGEMDMSGSSYSELSAGQTVRGSRTQSLSESTFLLELTPLHSFSDQPTWSPVVDPVTMSARVPLPAASSYCSRLEDDGCGDVGNDAATLEGTRMADSSCSPSRTHSGALLSEHRNYSNTVLMRAYREPAPRSSNRLRGLPPRSPAKTPRRYTSMSIADEPDFEIADISQLSTSQAVATEELEPHQHRRRRRATAPTKTSDESDMSDFDNLAAGSPSSKVANGSD